LASWSESLGQARLDLRLAMSSFRFIPFQTVRHLSFDVLELKLTNTDAFFAGSSFSVSVNSQNLDQVLAATLSESTPVDPIPNGSAEQPLLPFSCECSPSRNADFYPSLAAGNAIRILEVMPGTHESPLICALHIAILPQAVNSYSALSYAWQIDFMPHPPQTVVCNDREVQIGENLFDALRRVRTVTSSQMIWAAPLQPPVVSLSVGNSRSGAGKVGTGSSRRVRGIVGGYWIGGVHLAHKLQHVAADGPA
jgi:hypothetical protein